MVTPARPEGHPLRSAGTTPWRSRRGRFSRRRRFNRLGPSPAVGDWDPPRRPPDSAVVRAGRVGPGRRGHPYRPGPCGGLGPGHRRPRPPIRTEARPRRGRRAARGSWVGSSCPSVRSVAARSRAGCGPPSVRRRTPTRGGRPALNAALVLLMDHELAASTMAARIAAGTGADPWLVAPHRARRARRPAARAQQRRRRRRSCSPPCGARGSAPSTGMRPEAADRLPGFGHKVYVDADPRAEVLLDHVARLDPDGAVESPPSRCSRWRARRFGLSPNVDLGLAALAVRRAASGRAAARRCSP